MLGHPISYFVKCLRPALIVAVVLAASAGATAPRVLGLDRSGGSVVGAGLVALCRRRDRRGRAGSPGLLNA